MTQRKSRSVKGLSHFPELCSSGHYNHHSLLLRPGRESAILLDPRDSGTHDRLLCGETDMLQGSQRIEYINIMGDRSPKSNQKKSNQKQSKADSAAQSKQK